jgi:phosphohistidine phosphatase SixA
VVGSRSRIFLSVLAGATIHVALLSANQSHSQDQALRPQLEGQELVDALRKGGLVVLMRHMSTDSFVPQEGAVEEDQCANQRNLDQRGRQEARDVGVAFTKLEIPVGAVLTSPYCRCVETGKLAFGGGIVSEELAASDDLSSEEKTAWAKRVRKLLNTAPVAGRNTVMITHTGTLLYSFGLQSRPEGIAHVFRPAEFGNAVYLGRVTPEEWFALARASGAGS